MTNRPYIFCHMFTSLDGKITGSFFDAPGTDVADTLFYHEAFEEGGALANDGWLSGRTTTDDNFTMYEKPALTAADHAATVPAGDYLDPAAQAPYYFSVDPRGVLAWTDNTLRYETTTAHVVELLSGQASAAYKAFLRRLHISYLIAGDTTFDPRLAVEKLATQLHVNRVMLGGGGVLNWSFIAAGVCDEVSLVMAPAADASANSPSVFMSAVADNPDPVAFKLKDVQTVADTVWLRYTVVGAH
ncbi:MAG: RibD family protein [Lactobacillus sp.]|jgi:riboflavin biosynthesis pyrimidine reductase|nr:RibD family protein [Lactobacillus sp.]MCI2033310.1 RibD family protein [Lactobacillus sp.]